jgi:hypothetical protein
VKESTVTKPVLALIALSLLPACPLLEAQVDVPEVCITYDDIEVLAAATEVDQQIVVDDLGEIHELVEHAEDLTFKRAEAIAVSGVGDFSFVDSARIAIAPGRGDGAVTPLTLYQCDGDCVSSADALVLSDDERHDVLDYLRGDAITLDLAITGDLPQVTWTMSVVVCFAGSARYSVGG